MSNVGFNATHWDHWLLIASFLAIALLGLQLSWQWRKEKRRQQKSRLLWRLSSEMYHDGESGRGASAYGKSAELKPDAMRKRRAVLSARHLPRSARGRQRVTRIK
ncbi:MAG: hypothetical protein AAF703_12135 [Cyanobacteria bacterium P01_D01_bin.105]